MFCKCTSKNDNPPAKGEEGKPVRGSEFPDDEVGRNLKDEVGDEEHKECNGITIILFDAKIFFHACNASNRYLH